MAQERCLAKLCSGAKCTNNAINGSNYCGVHIPSRAVRKHTKKAAKKKKK
jgi:hypothetical protein